MSPKDNLTCTACDSSCGTCAGSSTFCLTCTGNQLASEGKCSTSCPTNTFQSTTTSGTCVSCHPDCETCTGSSFTQCASCPPSRPVLSNGRCLPTCSKTQFFDSSSNSCVDCDSSCASCSGSGTGSCLSCADSTGHILRGGSCVPATCTGNTTVVPGLGACLSDLVEIPSTSSNSAPLPSLTGITTPTEITEKGSSLAWWEILLMALGCAFLIMLILLVWRKRARRKRMQQTRVFAITKGIDGRGGWKERLVRFGERLFGHGRRNVYYANDPITLQETGKRSYVIERVGDIEAGRPSNDLMIDNTGMPKKYQSSRSLSRSLSTSTAGHSKSSSRTRRVPVPYIKDDELSSRSNRIQESDASVYTEITGNPRRAVETRQPLKSQPMYPSRSRFGQSRESLYSISSFDSTGSDLIDLDGRRRRRDLAPTPAQEYATSVLTINQIPEEPTRNYHAGGVVGSGSGGDYWLRPTHTGDSGGSSTSKNPFRR